MTRLHQWDCPCCLRDTNLNWTKPAAMNLTLMYFTVLSHLVRSLAHPEPGLFQPGWTEIRAKLHGKARVALLVVKYHESSSNRFFSCRISQATSSASGRGSPEGRGPPVLILNPEGLAATTSAAAA
eukprot:s619_g31.t4